MIRRIPRVIESKEDEICKKHADALAERFTENDQKKEFTVVEEEVRVEKKEELPFQDILADQRRLYNSTQKYVQLMYNDLAKIFVKKWDGKFLRKTVFPKQSLDRFPPENEEDRKDEVSEDDVEATIDKKGSTLDLKLYKPDEIAEVVFVNGNTYNGRISKQKMEGEGLYRWHNGSRYKGEFEDNKIQGKGSLDFQDCVRYEGNFEDGYLHGKGTMVDKNYNLLYIGEWKKGRKHGKGYCRFEKNDSYDGDWMMDKREGIGNRLYPNGARYIGDWKNDLRHGTGSMSWPNGDFYRGEWNQGEIHGYGEYTWNKFFNKSLCWPQEICYMGQWHQGACNGKGQLSLNSIGGAKYSGEWKKNKKHGYGMIIGNNGDVTEGDPLFEDNMLLSVSTTKNLQEDKEKNNTKEDNVSNLHEFMMKPNKVPEARVTSILKPEQCPSLWYYTDRLRKKESISSSLISLISGKCRRCEDISCRCLRQSNNVSPKNQDRQTRSLKIESTSKELSSSVTSSLGLDQRDDNPPILISKINDLESIKLEEEERWAYKCIALHMSRIRKIYEIYSKIFCDESPKCRLSMSRLSLWQLWRDCGIHKKTLSLVQIDKYLAANKSTLMEDPHCPYERIQIWQLIHALLEVAWHLYTKNEDIDEKGYPGKLANGLHKFLINDIYPNVGNSTGILCGPERDLLPIYPVYQLYNLIGKPHTARQLLKTICSKQGTSETKISNFIPEGRSFVTVEEKLNYLSSSELALNSKPLCSKERDDLSTHSLLVLRELGATELIKIMSIICPSLKDPETDIVVNMEYELTFLEFMEIFIEAGKRLVCKKNMQREVDRKKFEAVETASMMSIAKEDKTSRSAIRLSVGSKSTKSRKKLVKKH